MTTERLREAAQDAMGALYAVARETGAIGARAYADALRAALAAAPVDRDVTEFSWLIERGQPEGQVPTVWWWLRTGGLEGWTEVASEAVRFDSREAAEEIIAAKFTPPESRGGPSARAVEHGFLAEDPR